MRDAENRKRWREEYVLKNKDKIKEQQKIRSQRYYLLNRNKMLQSAARQRKYEKQKLSPEQLILQRIRHSARHRGLEFDLEVEDIIIPEYCPYLGYKLQFGDGRPEKNSYSVDRVDNSLGYVKGNIEVISKLANAMKQNATEEEQIRFAKEVLRRYEVP